MENLEYGGELGYTIDDLIEEIEYELQEAKELKAKAVEDSHDDLIKTANTKIVIIEARLWQVKHKRNLALSIEHLAIA